MREEPPITFRQEAPLTILSSNRLRENSVYTLSTVGTLHNDSKIKVASGWCEKGGCSNTLSSFKAIPLRAGSRKGNLTTPLCLENEARRDHGGFELLRKPQGKAHHPKRQVARKFGMTVNVSVELWYSLDPMRVFMLGVGAMGVVTD